MVFARRLIEVVFPRLCLGCGIPLWGRIEDGVELCHRCRAAAAHYGPVADAVRAFKYRARLGVADGLAGLMLRRANELDRPHDLVIPVPLHPRRLRLRGFNQAWLLARRLAAGLGIEADARTLARVRFTVPQVGLSDADRRVNVRGAFALNEGADLKGARVILIDDVLTTGATVNECSRVLKAAGVEWVTVLTVTRTVPR